MAIGIGIGWRNSGALAHPSPLIVTETAQICLKLFQQGGPGSKHRQSQRFLCPEFDGGPSDPPLRKAIELLAEGHRILELPAESRAPLARWLSAFRAVRTVERSVEGVHSIISKLLKRAPAAKVPYLSLELRYHMLRPLLAELAFSPAATCLHQTWVNRSCRP